MLNEKKIEVLTTTGLSHQIEQLISKADKFIMLVSPYLKIPEVLLSRLIAANERYVEIYVVYGKNELTADEQKKLDALANLNLYFCKNLHAKVFIVGLFSTTRLSRLFPSGQGISENPGARWTQHRIVLPRRQRANC